MVDKNYFQPKMETIEPCIKYAITVSPSNDLLTANTLRGKVIAVSKYMRNQLFMTPMEVKLFPELSPVGRLHYHGTIEFPTHLAISMWYHHTFRVLQCSRVNIKITAIDDERIWEQYCNKQRDYMYALFESLRLGYIFSHRPIPVESDEDEPIVKDILEYF